MRIAVCFKIVADFEDVIPSDWDCMEALDFSYVKKIYGCYDEAALETALRFRDELTAAGEPVRCVAVTAGHGPAVLLSGLYAAGFDEVMCIEGGDWEGSPVEGGPTELSCIEGGPLEHLRIEGGPLEFAPGQTAELLCGFLKAEQPDLIFTGQSVGACDSGMVPPLIAAGLGYEWLGSVTEVHYNYDEKWVEAVCENEDLLVNWALRGPAVLTVGNAKASALRMFSLKARMEAGKKTVKLWRAINACVEDDASSVTAYADYLPDAFYSDKKAGCCRMIAGDGAQMKAEVLLDRIWEAGGK